MSCVDWIFRDSLSDKPLCKESMCRTQAWPMHRCLRACSAKRLARSVQSQLLASGTSTGDAWLWRVAPRMLLWAVPGSHQRRLARSDVRQRPGPGQRRLWRTVRLWGDQHWQLTAYVTGRASLRASRHHWSDRAHRRAAAGSDRLLARWIGPAALRARSWPVTDRRARHLAAGASMNGHPFRAAPGGPLWNHCL